MHTFVEINHATSKKEKKKKKRKKIKINHATSSNLYRSYYPHRSRELVSPVCGIFLGKSGIFICQLFRRCRRRWRTFKKKSYFIKQEIYFTHKNYICERATAQYCSQLRGKTVSVLSYIRKEKCRPATTPTPVYVRLRLSPLDSETGWTGELWSNPVLLILEN